MKRITLPVIAHHDGINVSGSITEYNKLNYENGIHIVVFRDQENEYHQNIGHGLCPRPNTIHSWAGNIARYNNDNKKPPTSSSLI